MLATDPLRSRYVGERAVWSGALVIAAALLAVLTFHTPPDVRLYWEYGGRLLGRAYVTGYTDWVQHSHGQSLPVSSAAVHPAEPPYSAFHCEYPPGALLLFGVVRLMADDPVVYGYVFATFMALLMLATAHLSGRLALRLGGMTGSSLWAASATVAVVPLLIGALLIRRFDVVPAFFAAVGFSLLLARRVGMGATAFGFGGAVKLWPALIVILATLHLWRMGQRRDAALCAVAGTFGFLVPHAVMIAMGTHPADVLGYLAYLRDRPVQIESVIGIARVVVAKLSGARLTISHDFGSDNVIWSGDRIWLGAAAAVNLLAVVGICVMCAIRTGRQVTPAVNVRLLLVCSGAMVAAMALCSRVFSGEYLIWLMPFVLGLAGRRYGLSALVAFVGSCAALRVSYHYWDALVGLEWRGVLPCVVKNLCVAVVATAFAQMLGRGGLSRVAEPT